MSIYILHQRGEFIVQRVVAMDSAFQCYNESPIINVNNYCSRYSLKSLA